MTHDFDDDPTPHESGTMTCDHPEGCDAELKDHKWAKVKAEGWFFQRVRPGEQRGKAYCPAHVPEWVEAWRARRG